MTVFPARRSVAFKAATASSSVETLPMFVRSCPSRTRWTISLSCARSDSTTKSTAKPFAGRASGWADDGDQGSSGTNEACRLLPDVAADDIEHQIDSADIFEDRGVEIDELPRAEVEHCLTVDGTSGADDVGAGFSCELRHHRSDGAGRTVHEDA